MGIFSWLTQLFRNETSSSEIHQPHINSSGDEMVINPANGLPMMDGMCGIDVEGNAYGTDFSHEYTFSSDSSIGDFLR